MLDQGAEVRQGSTEFAVLLRWLAGQPDETRLELSCGERPDPGMGRSTAMVVQLNGCLAELAPAGFLELVVAGAKSVTVRLDGCAQAAETGRRVAEAAALLSACGREQVICVVEEQTCRAGGPDEKRVAGEVGAAIARPVYRPWTLPVSRRQLFRGPRRNRRPVPDPTGDERERTLAVLAWLLSGSHAPTSLQALARLEAGSAELSASGCRVCGVCVRACPTGALTLERIEVEHQPDVAALVLSPGACVDCGRCIQLCPHNALTTAGRVSWAAVIADDARTLASVEVRTCVRCHTPINLTSAGDLCDVCAFRRRNPFGAATATDHNRRFGISRT